MKNQEFKTLDMALLITLFVVVTGVLGSILMRGRMDTDQQRVQRLAENISLQLMDRGLSNFQHPPDKNYRGLASLQNPQVPESLPVEKNLGVEGTIGKDPWGNSFRYKFVEGLNGEWSHLVIWSPGPNAIVETQFEDWTYERLQPKNVRVPSSNDDFVFVKTF